MATSPPVKEYPPKSKTALENEMISDVHKIAEPQGDSRVADVSQGSKMHVAVVKV
jgi:hypothetical protein